MQYPSKNRLLAQYPSKNRTRKYTLDTAKPLYRHDRPDPGKNTFTPYS
jgi:hypothetical protein